jgi:hypothetical protein
MIFGGVQFLRSTYSPQEFNWKDDVSATSKSLKALKLFEEKINFPVDEVIASLQFGQASSESFIAIDTATNLNVKLQTQNNTLAQRISGLESEVSQIRETETTRRRFATRLSVTMTLVVSAVATLSIAFATYVGRHGLWVNAWTHVKAFVTESALIVLPALAIVPLVIMFYLLRRLGSLPQWLEPIARLLGGQD